MTHIELKKKIMLKVYTIYVFRRLREPFATEILLLLVSSFFLVFFVSIPHVLGNIPFNPTGFSHFAYVAVTNTSLIVQFILFSITVALVVLVRNFYFLYRDNNFIQRRFR